MFGRKKNHLNGKIQYYMRFKNIIYGRLYRWGEDHFHGYKFEVSPWSLRPLGLETLNRFLPCFLESPSWNFPFIHTLFEVSPKKKVTYWWQFRRARMMIMNIIKSWNKVSKRFVRSPHLVGTTMYVYWYAFSSVLVQESCRSCLCNDLN